MSVHGVGGYLWSRVLSRGISSNGSLRVGMFGRMGISSGVGMSGEGWVYLAVGMCKGWACPGGWGRYAQGWWVRPGGFVVRGGYDQGIGVSWRIGMCQGMGMSRGEYSHPPPNMGHQGLLTPTDMGYNGMRSVSGRYASYWNAFLSSNLWLCYSCRQISRPTEKRSG